MRRKARKGVEESQLVDKKERDSFGRLGFMIQILVSLLRELFGKLQLSLNGRTKTLVLVDSGCKPIVCGDVTLGVSFVLTCSFLSIPI